MRDKRARNIIAPDIKLNITNILSDIFRNLQHSGNLPSTNAYASLKEDLAFKEGEIEKSKNTLEGLQREHQQLNLNLGNYNIKQVVIEQLKITKLSFYFIMLSFLFCASNLL